MKKILPDVLTEKEIIDYTFNTCWKINVNRLSIRSQLEVGSVTKSVKKEIVIEWAMMTLKRSSQVTEDIDTCSIILKPNRPKCHFYRDDICLLKKSI